MSNKVLQAAFDKATKRVIAQGERSWSGASCRYRQLADNKMLKCAVGHLLTNKQIAKHKILLSGAAVMLPDTLVAELLPGVDVANGKFFLSSLQTAHDSARYPGTFVADFKANANYVAKQFDLEPIK